MIWLIIACVILLLLLCVFIYAAIINYKKASAIEERYNFAMRLIKDINNRIDWSGKRLKEIDERGAFKSDDEIGYFFTNVQAIQQILDEFAKQKSM